MRTPMKLFAVCMALLLAMSGTCSCAEKSNGWDMAYAALEQKTGYTRDQLIESQLVFEDGEWLFSVIIKDHPEDEDGLLIGEMDSNGTLINLSGPEKINLDTQLENDLKSCFNREDCWRCLAEVCQRWEKKLNVLSEEQKSTIWKRYIKTVERGIMLPPEDALAFPTAYETALKKAAAAEGWTEEMIHMFRHCISAYYVLDGTPVWFIYLEQHSWFEPEYESDADMNQYEKKLNAAFAGLNQEPPIKIGILIDAYTGELIEKPMLDYIPEEYHYLDFLIRTDEAVASICSNGLV